jgi:hypothetical protein
LNLRAALPAIVVFALHASLFGSWIVDDAGISFSYARNLARGEGLVAQVGDLPVEGFSNALWTLLLAGADVFGVFHPVLSVKILATVLVGLSFVLLATCLVRAWVRSALVVGLGLAATAASTPFVVWTVSGLENPLLVCLLSGLVALGLSIAKRGAVLSRDAFLLATGCFLLFLTRPDGLVYVAVPPFLIGLTAPGATKLTRSLIGYAVTFVSLLWVVTAFRIAYFHDVLPNTYYAKEGPLWQLTAALLESLGVVAGGLVFLVFASAVLLLGMAFCFWIGERLARKSVESSPLIVLASFVGAGLLAVELLPTDWMPEFRFATPLFLFGPLMLLELTSWIARSRGVDRGRRAQVVVGCVLVTLATFYSIQHTPTFAKSPTVPLRDIQQLSVSFDRLTQYLEVDRAVVLLPDIGGSLLEDRFGVLDLAGLTDRTIGRTHVEHPDAFSDYIRKRAPDFVWLHGSWVPRFGVVEEEWFRAGYLLCSAETYLERAYGTLYIKEGLGELSDCRQIRANR